jgi:chemotaxis protein MotB
MMAKTTKSKPPQRPNSNGSDTKKVKVNETMTLDVVPRRNRWLVVAIIVALIGVIIALFFHGSNVSSELETANEAKEKVAEELESSKKNLQATNAACDAKKTQCEEAQQSLQEQNAELESTLQNVKATVGELRDAKRKAARELAQFKRFSSQFQRMIDSGKLEVVFRKGRMVVNLPAQVLFDSGSAELTEDGLDSLKEVAKVLRKVKNKRFIVGGHTDNQKIQKASFESNWELASARAIIVTKALIKAGLQPNNLIAAGYSQYAPIANNQTEEGRKKNRRIEIILEPFLRDIEPPKAKSKATASKKKAKENKKGKSKNV